ncbi:ferritin-like domain-containing protein [Tunturiibacter gelidiferens]|uniref:ferritin-like domain-containing protein n=1 Tax=Tunturiibacter gelidiferens TaxID=3069689 RepID=UPI003D9B88C8
MEKKLNDLIDKALSRRQFLAGGTTAAAALVVGCNNSTTTPSPTPTPTPTPLDIPDNDILNFALNLEYLEAEFYLYAATGSGLSTADALTGAGTTKVPANIAAVPWTTPAQAQFAAELAQTELDHVRYLQAVIGKNSGTPVPRPTIDLTAFGPLGVAAGITTPFNPFADPNSFLVGAFTFEDVGVTAYGGAAPLLASNIILSGAAGLQAAEAYHAAAIRTLIAGGAANSGDATFLNDANKISAVRAMLGGGKETQLSISSIVAADPTYAIAFGRTTDQVLHIVYGALGAGLSKGGFFPNGLNGTITTTAS